MYIYDVPLSSSFSSFQVDSKNQESWTMTFEVGHLSRETSQRYSEILEYCLYLHQRSWDNKQSLPTAILSMLVLCSQPAWHGLDPSWHFFLLCQFSWLRRLRSWPIFPWCSKTLVMVSINESTTRNSLVYNNTTSRRQNQTSRIGW